MASPRGRLAQTSYRLLCAEGTGKTSGQLSKAQSRSSQALMLCRREKNWGFMEEDGTLLITYALLPCTVVLEFNPAQPEDLKICSRHCYVADAPAIMQYAGG